MSALTDPLQVGKELRPAGHMNPSRGEAPRLGPGRGVGVGIPRVAAKTVCPRLVFAVFRVLPRCRPTRTVDRKGRTGWGLGLRCSVCVLACWLRLDVRAAETPGADNPAVVIEGIYQWDLPLSPRIARVESFGHGAFRVVLQDAGWVIRYQSETAATNAAARTVELLASGDAQNVYVVHRLNPLWISPGVVDTEATFYPGNAPPHFERDAYNLWLAFVARRVLTHATGRIASPNATDLSLVYTEEAHCQYFWLTNDTSSSWPKLLLRSGPRPLIRDRRNGRLRRLDLPFLYTNGYPMLEGRWSGMTPTPAGPVPSRCEVSFFSVNEGNRSDTNLYTRLTFSCQVTNVYSGRPEPIPAGFDGRRFIFVTDHRFFPQGVAAVEYGLTNVWSAEVEGWIQRQAASRPRKSLEVWAMEQRGLRPGAWRETVLRWTARIFLAVLFAIPLYGFARRLWKRSHQQTQPSS